ncbi:MAG: GAF domain-containing sensor histidine kinase [Desulfobacterales bacterium]
MMFDTKKNLACAALAHHDDSPSASELIRRYKMICKLGQTVTSEIDLETLFELIMRQTAAITSSELASVFLYDEAGEQLWTRVSTDLNQNEVRMSALCGVAGWVLRSRSAQIVNEPYNDPRFFSGVDKKTGLHTRNILCTPLINRQRQCIGTLQALNKKGGDFDENDLELLTAASYYVAIALENAQLFEDLKALDKAKERAINHLAHEIKTPLAVVAGVLNHISTKAANRDLTNLEKALRRGERSIKRLRTLQEQIDDILRCCKTDTVPVPDVSRAALQLLDEIFADEAERYPEVLHEMAERLAAFNIRRDFAPENIHVATFVRGVCERAGRAMAGRDLRLAQNLDEEAVIHADWHVLDTVCSGLLKNAIENTPDEGAIEVTAKRVNETTLIEIKDGGVGITPVNQKMIFGGFFHTQPTYLYSSKKPYDFNAGGTGADLLRIKAFADRLGFEVEFVSRRCPHLPHDEDSCAGRISRCRFIDTQSKCLSGSGSTFSVRFPQVRPRVA